MDRLERELLLARFAHRLTHFIGHFSFWRISFPTSLFADVERLEQWYKVHNSGSRSGLKLDSSLPLPVPCEVRFSGLGVAVVVFFWLCCRILFVNIALTTDFFAGGMHHKRWSDGIYEVVMSSSEQLRLLMFV